MWVKQVHKWTRLRTTNTVEFKRYTDKPCALYAEQRQSKFEIVHGKGRRSGPEETW